MLIIESRRWAAFLGFAGLTVGFVCFVRGGFTFQAVCLILAVISGLLAFLYARNSRNGQRTYPPVSAYAFSYRALGYGHAPSAQVLSPNRFTLNDTAAAEGRGRTLPNRLETVHYDYDIGFYAAENPTRTVQNHSRSPPLLSEVLRWRHHEQMAERDRQKIQGSPVAMHSIGLPKFRRVMRSDDAPVGNCSINNEAFSRPTHQPQYAQLGLLPLVNRIEGRRMTPPSGSCAVLKNNSATVRIAGPDPLKQSASRFDVEQLCKSSMSNVTSVSTASTNNAVICYAGKRKRHDDDALQNPAPKRRKLDDSDLAFQDVDEATGVMECTDTTGLKRPALTSIHPDASSAKLRRVATSNSSPPPAYSQPGASARSPVLASYSSSRRYLARLRRPVVQPKRVIGSALHERKVQVPSRILSEKSSVEHPVKPSEPGNHVTIEPGNHVTIEDFDEDRRRQMERAKFLLGETSDSAAEPETSSQIPTSISTVRQTVDSSTSTSGLTDGVGAVTAPSNVTSTSPADSKKLTISDSSASVMSIQMPTSDPAIPVVTTTSPLPSAGFQPSAGFFSSPGGFRLDNSAAGKTVGDQTASAFNGSNQNPSSTATGFNFTSSADGGFKFSPSFTIAKSQAENVVSSAAIVSTSAVTSVYASSTISGGLDKKEPVHCLGQSSASAVGINGVGTSAPLSSQPVCKTNVTFSLAKPLCVVGDASVRSATSDNVGNATLNPNSVARVSTSSFSYFSPQSSADSFRFNSVCTTSGVTSQFTGLSSFGGQSNLLPNQPISLSSQFGSSAQSPFTFGILPSSISSSSPSTFTNKTVTAVPFASQFAPSNLNGNVVSHQATQASILNATSAGFQPNAGGANLFNFCQSNNSASSSTTTAPFSFIQNNSAVTASGFTTFVTSSPNMFSFGSGANFATSASTPLLNTNMSSSTVQPPVQFPVQPPQFSFQSPQFAAQPAQFSLQSVQFPSQSPMQAVQFASSTHLAPRFSIGTDSSSSPRSRSNQKRAMRRR